MRPVGPTTAGTSAPATPPTDPTRATRPGDTAREGPLRRCEMTLLEEAGSGLPLDQDADGRPLADDGLYRWEPEQGFLPDPRGYPGELLLALGRDEWNPGSEEPTSEPQSLA